jgi:hypothetical protein
MSVVIKESGLDFGEYEKLDLFHIEESSVYKSMGDSVCTIEFVLRHKNDEILLLEAKSSSPKPSNQVRFDEWIDEVYQKFSHSMDMYFSLVLKRLDDPNGDMPEYFKSADYSTAKIKLLLVINGHEIEHLPPICDALREKLRRQIKTWRLGFTVMNHVQAGEYGLLKE